MAPWGGCRVQEMGLLPEQQQHKSENSPIGENVGEELLPPRPSAVVEVPEALQGVQIPKSPM
jgi:cell division protein FtsN